MPRLLTTLLAFTFCLPGKGSADEASTIEFFQQHGDRVTTNDAGHATKLFCGGRPELSVAELQQIGELVHLEELAINAAPADDTQWEFLKSLPRLRKLTLWHGHHFRSLEAFNGLPVESITFGGCMGIRNLNQDKPDAQRNVTLTLRDLPNLNSLTLYHSPLTPGDAHLAHIVESFPSLTELRLDFAAPRGQQITITAEGLARLTELPLTRLALENADSLSPDAVAELGKIKTLKQLHIYPARGTPEVHNQSVENYRTILAPLMKTLPDLELTFQQPPAKK